MGSVGEAVLEARLAFLADPIRKPGMMPRDRIGEQSSEPAIAEPLHCPQRAGTRMVDALPGTSGHALEMCLRVARGDHRLKFRSVFAEVVPQGGEGGGFGCAPCLGEPASQSRGRSKVLFEIVRRVVARSPMSDRSGRSLDPGVRQRVSQNRPLKFLDKFPL